MQSLLIIFASILISIATDDYFPDDLFQIMVNKAIQFDELIVDIGRTAQQSTNLEMDIRKTYKFVFGPIEEMNGMNIGKLIVEFDFELAMITIGVFNDGINCIRLQMFCSDQHAEIIAIKKVPNKLSGQEVMILANTLLSALKCRVAYITDSATINYEGCNGQINQVQLIDLFVL